MCFFFNLDDYAKTDNKAKKGGESGGVNYNALKDYRKIGWETLIRLPKVEDHKDRFRGI
jgi:hypothetical protein